MGCPLFNLGSHFFAERSLMISWNAEDFGVTVFDYGVCNDFHHKREPVMKLRGWEEFVQER